jgi:hypothetical protein
MASMHKQELGRSIFRVVGSLLGTDRVEVPDMHPAIIGRRRKVDRRVRGPDELLDWAEMGFERMELVGQFSDIPEGDRLLISMRGGEQTWDSRDRSTR